MTLVFDSISFSSVAATAVPLFFLSIFVGTAGAQLAGIHHDESIVPPYELPDPLVLADGQPVRDEEIRRIRRRPEIPRLFEEHVYGPSDDPIRWPFDTCRRTTRHLAARLFANGSRSISGDKKTTPRWKYSLRSQYPAAPGNHGR